MDNSNWQTELSCVRERNQYAYNKSLFCDVEFSVVDSNGDKATIAAHKYVLAISSPVFEAMFYGQLAETGRTIHLQDCSKEGLQGMLRYVYSDEIQLTGKNVMEVLYLADKYDMPFLVEKCREYLERELGPKDVFIVLPQVQQLCDEKLEQHCWSIVDSRTEQAVLSEPFLDTSREILCQILGRESLKVTELALFQAVDKWVSKRIEEKGSENNGENKRAILGEEAIRLIRFPLMSQKEFAGKVLPMGILNPNEVTELIQVFNSLPTLTNMFCGKKRGRLLILENRFGCCLGAYSLGDNKTEAIDFTVNKSVFLVGVRMFGVNEPDNVRRDVQVHLCIYKSEEEISQLSSTFSAKLIDGQYFGFDIILDKPVRLHPDTRYSIVANTSYLDLVYSRKQFSVAFGSQCKSVVEFEDLAITYMNSTKYWPLNPVLRNQFPSLILQRI